MMPCVCTHLADQHNAAMGYCEAKECGCMCYQTAEELAEEEQMDGPTELDFDIED